VSVEQPSLLDSATVERSDQSGLSDDDRWALVGTANRLADSQIPNIQDDIGFSNADVFIGRALAAAVECGYATPDQERFLALLVAQKYRRQSAPALGEALERIALFGRSAPDRDVVKRGLAEPIRVKRTEDGAFLVEAEHRHNYYLRGLNAGREQTGIASLSLLKFSSPATCGEFIRRVTAANENVRVVGEPPSRDEIAATAGDLTIKVGATQTGSLVRLSFDYDPALVDAIKRVPGRRFDVSSKAWDISVGALAQAVDLLSAAGADTSALRELVPDYAPTGDHRFKVAVVRDGKRLSFPDLPYDAELVDAFKAIPTKKFDREKKMWSINVLDAPDLAPTFERLSAKFDASAFEEYAKVPEAPQEFPIIIRDERLARLRDYQREGVRLMTTPLSELQRKVVGGRTLRGILSGDDMGLGKTAQAAISADALVPPDGKALIICPANLRLNWQKELRKWLGESPSVCIVGDGQAVDPSARFTIVNYELLPKHYDKLRELQPDVLIIDEAHYIKNPKALRSVYIVGGRVKNPDYNKTDPKSQQYRRVEGLCDVSKRVFPLTGTPIPNHVRDSFNLWKAIGHPVAANKRRFDERYCEGHEEYVARGRVAWKNDGASNLEELRQLVAPVFLQRKKSDVLSLPPKQRTFMPVEVDHKEYHRVMRAYRDRGPLRADLAIQLMTEQRMATALSKAAATTEFAENCIEQGEKVVIFSKSTRALDVIEKKMTDSLGASSIVRLDGNTGDMKAKERVVERFQAEEEVKVFLGQIDAAGTGIGLTAANRVIMNDLGFEPLIMQQAEDRVYRSGQERQVQVTYMIADGTIDEYVGELLEHKLDAITTFEGVDNNMLAQLRERLEREVLSLDDGPSTYKLASGL